MNKNISVWRGEKTPPTKYHLWQKDDTIYINIENEWLPLASVLNIILLEEVITNLNRIKDIELVEVNASNNNILKSYKLKSGDSYFGTTIDIPKDKSIKDIKLGYANASVDKSTGEITIGTGTNPLYMIYSIALEDGSYKMISIDLSLFITEKEYKDGLELVDNSLLVKIDKNSDPLLTISSNGIKLEGVQGKFNSLDTDIATIKKKFAGKLDKASVVQLFGNSEELVISLKAVSNKFNELITLLKAEFSYKGIATPTTNPGTPDGNVFYIAGEGTYTNFSEISVDKGELAVLTWNGTWSKQSLKVGLPPNELNISHLFPTNGEGGTNRYTLAGAIAQVPIEYRVQGLKVSFINESGVSETWEFLGNDWSIDNFSEVGARIISEAADKVNKVAGGQVTDVFLFENLEDVEYIISANKVISNVNPNWKGVCINVSKGDTLIYKLNGGSGKALYYTDSEDNLISDIQDNSYTEKQVIVPQGATKAYVRTHYSATEAYIKHLYVSKGIIGDVDKLKVDVNTLDDKLKADINILNNKVKEIDHLNNEVKELKYIFNPTIEKVECFKGAADKTLQDIFLDARYTGENFICVGYFKHVANSGTMDLRIYQYNNEQGEQLLGIVYRNENISTDYSEKITIEYTNFKCVIDPTTLADKNVYVGTKTWFSDIVYEEHDGELNPPKGLTQKTDEALKKVEQSSVEVEGIKTNLSSVNDYVSELFEKRKRVIEMYPQGLTMCNIGDSFTYNNNHFYNKEGIPTYTKGYISRIIGNLPFLHYYNCGRDGKRYVDWGNGGQAYELPIADIYTILLGTNDWNNASSYKISVGENINFENPTEDGTDYTIMGNLRKLMNRIYEKNQKAKVIIFNPVERVKFVFVNNKTNTQPGGWATDTPAKMTLKDYSLAIYNTIKDLDFTSKYPTMEVKAVNLYEESNFTFYNIMKYIDVNGNKIVYPDSINDGYDGNTNDYPYPQSSEGYMYDGLHPNDSGNEVISLIMTKYIVDILLNSRYIINSVNSVLHNYYYQGVTTSVFVECDY